MAQAPSNPKIDELRARLSADPKSRLFYPLAEELRRDGQFAEAEQVLHSGLSNHPTYLSAWVCMGRVLRDQEKDREAVDALLKAMQIDRENVVAARLLADAYVNLGEKVEAIKKYKLVQALLPADEELKGVIERLNREITMPSVPISVVADDEEAWPQPAAARESATFVSGEPELHIGVPQPSVFSASQPLLPEDHWADSSNPLGLTATAPAFETRDAEPMLAAHDDSPFEEPLHGGYTSAAVEIEAPPGMQIIDGPLAAEVAAPWNDDPVAETSAYDDEEPVADEPLTSEPPPPEDLINTITMADLYERQGLTDQAKRIYENILARDPGNEEIRARLDRQEPTHAVTAPEPADPRSRKIAKLQAWLDKVGGSEGASV